MDAKRGLPPCSLQVHKAISVTRTIDHGGKQGPPLSLVSDHLAEGDTERRRYQEDRQHFKKIGESGRVFEGMGRVDIEEPAAVRAELLDRDLRSSGSERYDLLLHLRLFRHRISLFILDRVALGIELRVIVGDGLGERTVLYSLKVCTTP